MKGGGGGGGGDILLMVLVMEAQFVVNKFRTWRKHRAQILLIHEKISLILSRLCSPIFSTTYSFLTIDRHLWSLVKIGICQQQKELWQ